MELENEKLITMFLYGELPEEDRFDLESRFIADHDLFEQIKVVEDELIGKYISGGMDLAERSRFEQHFLTTNKRRERVEFSQQFLDAVKRQKEDAEASPLKKNEGLIADDISVWGKLVAFWLTPKGLTAGAFVLIAALVGGWFLFQVRSNRRPEVAKNEDATVGTTPEAVMPTPLVSPSRPIDVDQNSSLPKNDTTNVGNGPRESTTPTPGAERSPEKPKVDDPVRATDPVFALIAGTLRSGGSNRVIDLTPGAKTVTLQLNLKDINYKTYRARLTDADGKVLFQRANLESRGSTIDLRVPAGVLKRGDYVVKLDGKNAAGEDESAADFQFRVNR